MDAMAALVAVGAGLAMVTGWAARPVCERNAALVSRPLTAEGLGCRWGVVLATDVPPDHATAFVGRNLASWLSRRFSSS